MLPKSENREMTEAPHELPRITRGHNALKPPRYSLGVRLLPGLLALSYLVFSVLIFVGGPWPWPVTNPWKLYTFLRSEEHTSELQSLRHLVCRPLLEKKHGHV